ncbi:MAG: hypothetical protein K2H02_03635 [Anaeroplasmataceae bacterium]|nr:hypothetical protein [Anaeroplasmataceae bacterium]MDE6013812.1 hypothetical protein [Anaeroplasmataceae bacterium]
MTNEPTLFIHSVDDKKEGSENQDFYDSRNASRKKVAHHRLEDIEAMLYYRIHVLAEVYTKRGTFEGIVEEVSDLGLKLQMENEIKMIPIVEIEDINILKL